MEEKGSSTERETLVLTFMKESRWHNQGSWPREGAVLPRSAGGKAGQRLEFRSSSPDLRLITWLFLCD